MTSSRLLLLLLTTLSLSLVPHHSTAAVPPTSTANSSTPPGKPSSRPPRNPPVLLELPYAIKTLHINIGPHLSPLEPPRSSPSTGVLAIEPNVAIAHQLRETFQKRKYASRFFVLPCAVAPPPLAGRLATFHHYNADGVSSSLATVVHDTHGRVPGFANRTTHGASGRYGPGAGGIDFVAVVSLGAVLAGVPKGVEVETVKIDAQGMDLGIVKSGGRGVRRVKRFVVESYGGGGGEKRYEGVKNELWRDWVPYMTKVGFRLENAPKGKFTEYDAIWERID